MTATLRRFRRVTPWVAAVGCILLVLGLPPAPPAGQATHRQVPATNAGALRPSAAGPKSRPTPSPSGPPADSAVAFQEDSGHTGGLAGDSLVPGLVQRWSTLTNGQYGYPLIVPGHIYTTGGNGVASTAIATGNVEWGHPIPFPPSLPGARELWSALAYDAGRLIVLDNLGTLLAYDALGNQLWLLQLPGNVTFSSAPTASAGIVYVTGTGGTPEVYAVDDAAGRLLWTSPVVSGFQSSPAVGPSGVYVGFLCQHVYGITAGGSALWHHAGGCATGGGRSPVLADGRLYARDPAGNLVLDALTGSQLGTFPASAPPAFAGSTGYFVHDGVLDARDAATLVPHWTFTGDGQLVTAPVVANGYVYVGSTAGNLFAVSAATGQSVWWSSVPGGFPAPDGPNAPPGPISGLAVGQGVLAVPSLGGFTVFSGGGPLSGPPPTPAPTPTPSPSPSPTPSPSPSPAPGGVVLGAPAFSPTGSSRPAAAWVGNMQVGTLSVAVADPANSSLDVVDGLAGTLFTDGQRLPAGSQPSGVTGGRFRSAGQLDDAAVANAGSNTVTVYLNSDGNPGGLTPGRSYPAGAGPADVTACDLNRDGKLDLAVADRDGGTVSVLLGNGDGTFGAAGSFPAGQTPVRVLCQDVDGDGNLDVVVANRDADAVSVLRGTGTGALGAPISRSLHAGARPSGLTAFDFNFDGRADVAVAESGTAQTGVLFGLGGGQLGQETTYATGAQPSAVTVVNGRSPFRLIAADAGDNDVSVLQGVQDGSFGPFGRFPTGQGPVSVASIGPGLIVADGGDGTVAVLPETSLAGYGAPTLATGARPQRVAVADMNGDGHPDVVVQNGDFGSITIRNGTGGVALGGSHDYPTGAGQVAGLAVGDLNGDGRPDVVVVDATGGAVIVLLNTGGGLGPPQRFATGVRPVSVAIGDVNGDGHPDLAVADGGVVDGFNHLQDDVGILLGNGDGTFQAVRPIPAGPGPTRVALGDLNGDGKLDVVNEADGFGIWSELGNGDGTFQAPVNSGSAPSLLDLTLGDVNGDGRLDAIASGTSLAFWFAGNGDGTFKAEESIDRTQLTDSAEPGVVAGDLNRDGALDVVVSDFNADAAGVFVASGGGAYFPRVRIPVGVGPNGVAIADLNGDGFPEILLADAASGDVALLPNLTGQSGVTVALQGTVTAQPACTAQRTGGGACSTPLAGARVEVFSDGTLVAAQTTDAAGRYAVRLRPGQYVVRVTNPSLPRNVSERTLNLSSDTVANLSVDSGIR